MNLKTAVCILSLTISSISWACPQPGYLNVPEWQSCVSHINCGEAQFACLPEQQLALCPALSWQTLVLKNLLPFCFEGCNAVVGCQIAH